MPAYWIARMTVTEPTAYARYAAAATRAFAEYGARVLARGGETVQLEGEGRPRNVIIAFDSLEQALTCYRSKAYQAARADRVDAGVGEIVIVDGV